MTGLVLVGTVRKIFQSAAWGYIMSENAVKLTISPYKYHAVMCAGKSCGENIPLFKYMKAAVLKAGLNQGRAAVRVNRAGCLGVCEQGPIMVVYPGGVWYSELNESRIDKIITSHFKGGEPVTEWVFHAQGK